MSFCSVASVATSGMGAKPPIFFEVASEMSESPGLPRQVHAIAYAPLNPADAHAPLHNDAPPLAEPGAAPTRLSAMDLYALILATAMLIYKGAGSLTIQNTKLQQVFTDAQANSIKKVGLEKAATAVVGAVILIGFSIAALRVGSKAMNKQAKSVKTQETHLTKPQTAASQLPTEAPAPSATPVAASTQPPQHHHKLDSAVASKAWAKRDMVNRLSEPAVRGVDGAKDGSVSTEEANQVQKRLGGDIAGRMAQDSAKTRESAENLAQHSQTSAANANASENSVWGGARGG